MLVKNIAKINPKPTSHYTDFINYIDTSSVNDGVLSTVTYLDSNFPSRAQREVFENDILISSVRPRLKHNYFVSCKEPHLIASTGFVQIRVNSDSYLPQYVYYYLTSEKQVVLYDTIANSSQTTFPTFNKDVIESLEIPTISIDEQHHIVNTIGSVDDLIENYNNQINLLRTFGNQKYQQLNFVYSEPIKQFFTFVKGKEVGSKNYLTENSKQATPYIRVGNLLSGQYDTFVEDAEIVANNDDILIAFDGAPGRNNIGLHGAYSSGIYKVESSVIYKGIIYFYLNSEYCQNVIKVNSQGTTILHAGKAIKELLFPQEISEACLDEFNLIFKQIIGLIEKRNVLLEQKKLLLAKYFE